MPVITCSGFDYPIVNNSSFSTSEIIMNIRHQVQASVSPNKPFSPIVNAACLILLLLTCPGVSAAVDSQSVAALQAQVTALQTRVGQLEQQLVEVLKLVQRDTSAPAVARTQPAKTVALAQQAEVPRPSIKVGGRIKVDGVYNNRSATSGSNHNLADLSFAGGNIPIAGTGQRDKLNFSARETRLWVTAQVPTPAATLGAYVEMDFSSADDSGNEKVSNSYVPRLRHAYVDYGAFTAGQTWTTFMNVSAFPDMNDTGGPAGIINVRQPMLRYQHDVDLGRIYLALEQPESTLTTATGARIATDDEHIPDIIGKMEFTGDWGNWSVAAMVRQIRIVDGGNASSAWGGAVSASGRINFLAMDNIRFALTYGNVLGRYLSLNADDDGVLDVRDDIRLTEAFGAYLSYQHWWSPSLRSSLTLGYSHADPEPIWLPVSAEVNESIFSSHLNLIWNLTSAATVGVEWIHGERRLTDGREGSLDRVQFTSMFRF